MTQKPKPSHQEFLDKYFTDSAHSITPIQGDAGFRSYFRINNAGKTYILMDCPPDYCSTQPFIEISHYLRSHQFSAPEIIAFDTQKGLIILEDFGDLSVKTFLENATHAERKKIYYLIIDILIELQAKTPPANLKIYDNELLLGELAVFVDYYIPYSLGRALTNAELEKYQDIWRRILKQQKPCASSIVLRDYHVENMMYLENRNGISAFGLLDFQDALVGSPIYDLVSVLEDARIEVPRALALDCVEYFAQAKQLLSEDVMTNYHILGAQRNSRILGVFARKAARDGNNNYLQYIPLVLSYLQDDMSHPVMRELGEWYGKVFG
jgi:aminoglycoside/choline kinase family phosphotransferase